MSNENSKLGAERELFQAYLDDCQEHDLEPNVAGAFRFALQASSLPVGVPDGYALVPVEPTPEMQAAALSAQQSAPEFCCEHSFNAAKQAAWDARRMDRCKCDHNEHCEHCWPDTFKEGGKWHKGFEKQQSAPERVSVPVELLERVTTWREGDEGDSGRSELRALLASHGRG